jgi:hypothetical protein
MTEQKNFLIRREVLFCYDLLTYIQCIFPDIKFYDNFKGYSRTEIYFVHDNQFFLLEAKSEVETANSHHPGWKGSFQDLRNAIRALHIANKYNKWLLYLAQLYDYTIPPKRATQANGFQIRHVVLGLPLSRLGDCEFAISQTTRIIASTSMSFETRQCDILRVAILIIRETDLIVFMDAIRNYTLSNSQQPPQIQGE